ncbi:MAG: VWA domain-containing protein, partial [Phycisphaerales bacterium]
RPPRPPRPRPRPPQRNMPLEVKKHAVDTSIVDGVAVTRLDQVFFNPYDRTVEGTYIFPLADDVALSKFSMYVNGQEIEGKLLGVEEARRQYESIVAKMRDPALLEYLGTRMFRARIFPINPKTEVRVKLSYTQMLISHDGLVRYRYPLGTEKHLAAPVETVSVLVNIESKTPIKSVFSPSHKMVVSRPSEYKAGASYEGKNVFPDKNFELYYALGDKEFGLTVLTYRESGQDGFFLARIAPPAKTSAQDVLAKDIAFVIDTSGSMAGEKMDQARRALKFCLSNLNKEDRFNVIPFSHEATTFRDTLVLATGENTEKARKFADELRGIGGTNINDALLTALTSAPTADADRPYLIVFLTDGQPTIGVTAPNEILKNVSGKNTGRVRLFVFGVGYDVNTHLLDLLAEQNRGARDYVEPDEDLELTLASFYRKVSEPVLADLSLSFGDLRVYDMFPPELGDLFAGSELVVAGRYKDVGAKAVTLTGRRRGRKEQFVYETTFPSEAQTHDFLPRLWATRKVGYLLDHIRLHGENKELKDTIVELATKYGIVTPYTAYLVTEPGSIAMRPGGRGHFMTDAVRQGTAYGVEELRPPLVPRADSPGGGSVKYKKAARARVQTSVDVNALRVTGMNGGAVADLIRRLREGEEANGRRTAREPIVRSAGARTFYRIGDRWIDANYDEKVETKKVEAFSEEYFQLIRKHPELAKCFALGERIIVVVDGAAYETVPSAEE